MPLRRRRVCGLLLLSLLCAGPVLLNAQEAHKPPETCDGPYNGKHLSSTELTDVLALHDKWLGKKPGGQQANLCKARLEVAHLQGAVLRKANLQEAVLHEADLRGAKLQEADLRGASLLHAKLHDAKLWNTQLQGADLKVGRAASGRPHHSESPSSGSEVGRPVWGAPKMGKAASGRPQKREPMGS